MSQNPWETEATNWLRWARAPGHDAYWKYRDSFFDHIVPAPRGTTLEIGCGEGRVARDLSDRGHHVVALDSSPTLINAANDARLSETYLLADATALPFPDEEFDSVVAYNSLLDVKDLDKAVLEAGRVLAADGSLSVCIVHPVNEAGGFTREYLSSWSYDMTFERDGMVMRFHSHHRPIEQYAKAFELAGLVIDRVREPGPSDQAIRKDGQRRRQVTAPMFLHLRGRKLV